MVMPVPLANELSQSQRHIARAAAVRVLAAGLSACAQRPAGWQDACVTLAARQTAEDGLRRLTLAIRVRAAAAGRDGPPRGPCGLRLDPEHQPRSGS
jgi:hypothetical protein